jgi:hypothetical protein
MKYTLSAIAMTAVLSVGTVQAASPTQMLAETGFVTSTTVGQAGSCLKVFSSGGNEYAAGQDAVADAVLAAKALQAQVLHAFGGGGKVDFLVFGTITCSDGSQPSLLVRLRDHN